MRTTRGAADIDLTIATSVRAGWQVLGMHGDLDLYTSPGLREQVVSLDDGGRVALDLSDVGFADSSGLGAMVASLSHVKDRGGSFAIVVPEGSAVDRLLRLTGLDQVLRVARSVEELPTA
jgi:anti-sigma B factor antagonist